MGYNISETSIYNTKKISKIFSNKNKIIAYGTGSLYTTFKGIITNLGLFIDETVYNIESDFFHPDQKNIHEALNNNIVIICTIHYKEVISFIRKNAASPKKIIILNLKGKEKYEKEKIYTNIKRVKKNHTKQIVRVKNKEKINVVFLVPFKSTWRTDTLFLKMQQDQLFNPMILICPCITIGEQNMWAEMKSTSAYFSDKGYPAVSAFCDKRKQWIKIEDLKPDILFFTNPHKLTIDEYYEKALENHLTCYVPYYSDIASNYNLQESYNKEFHNIVWKIFYESEYSLNRAKEISYIKAINSTFTGSLFIEDFISCKKNYDKWKSKDKKRIIYAPHQSIIKIDNLHLSTFLEVSSIMRQFAIEFEEQVEWCFKPHPLLKDKLYKHPHWGKIKTDEYYAFWNSFSSSHMNDGEYKNLFKSADAIIHDCGSFILESLLNGQPSGFLLLNEATQLISINNRGKKLLECHKLLYNKEQIKQFILDIIDNKAHINKSHQVFLNKIINLTAETKKPSDKIIEALKTAIIQSEN